MMSFSATAHIFSVFLQTSFVGYIHLQMLLLNFKFLIKHYILDMIMIYRKVLLAAKFIFVMVNGFRRIKEDI